MNPKLVDTRKLLILKKCRKDLFVFQLQLVTLAVVKAIDDVRGRPLADVLELIGGLH